MKALLTSFILLAIIIVMILLGGMAAAQNFVAIVFWLIIAGLVVCLYRYLIRSVLKREFGVRQISSILFLFVTNVFGLVSIVGLIIIYFDL